MKARLVPSVRSDALIPCIFLLFTLTCLCSFVPPIVAVATCLKFRLVTEKAPFTARWSPNVETFPNTLSFRDSTTGNPVSFPPSSMVLYGGADAPQHAASNDVWSSSNGGARWSLIAGRTSNGSSAYGTAAQTSFEPRANAAHCSTLTGRQYIIGGFTLEGGARSNSVFYSDNLLSWKQSMPSGAWFTPRVDAACVPVPTDYSTDASLHSLVCVGGWTDNGDDGGVSNQVWIGTAGGARWRLQKAGPFAPRRSFPMVTYWSSPLQTNVIVFMTGVSRSGPYLSDVWASVDNGLNFVLITSATPFGERNDASAEVTSEGILTLVGGAAAGILRNDVFLSLNGGYTWTELVTDAPWADRWRQSTFFDSQLSLVVVGGWAAGLPLNDLYRSTVSFDEESVRLLADTCNIDTPSCGRLGMQCLPTAEDTQVTFNYHTGRTSITCAACSPSKDSSSPSSSGVNVLAVVLAVVAVLLLLVSLLLLYVLRVVRASGAPPPLPGLQSCWTALSFSHPTLTSANAPTFDSSHTGLLGSNGE